MRRQRGFTLIESLAVMAIIGVLAALATYGIQSALQSGRDTQRKSDLSQISEAFVARSLAQTCTNQTAIGYYPGGSLEQNSNSANNAWILVSQLTSSKVTSEGCGSFTNFLPTIPNDPQSPSYSYYFNVSTVPIAGRHFRLTAALENQYASSSSSQTECTQNSQIWAMDFGGFAYGCTLNGGPAGNTGRSYDYTIGQ